MAGQYGRRSKPSKKTFEKFGPHLRKTTFEKVKISLFEGRYLTFEKYNISGHLGRKNSAEWM
jgi:hypothetical protein